MMSEENDNDVASEEVTQTPAEEPSPPSFGQFLESSPPSQDVTVRAPLKLNRPQYGDNYFEVDTPAISLHCENEKCQGPRIFRCDDTLRVRKTWKYSYVTYACSNCKQQTKTYSLAHNVGPSTDNEFLAYKFGELPVFGPLVPEKLKKLVGRDRDIFFRGLRCEAQGLGIGAFAYYRRVVEDRKNKLLDQLIKVTKTVDPSNKIIDEFEAAKAETQFTKAIDNIKGSFPQSLLIEGKNPLKLLHQALSQGIHDHSDDECLALAQGIRVVLSELIERMDSLSQEKGKLADAVKLLGK